MVILIITKDLSYQKYKSFHPAILQNTSILTTVSPLSPHRRGYKRRSDFKRKKKFQNIFKQIFSCILGGTIRGHT